MTSSCTCVDIEPSPETSLSARYRLTHTLNFNDIRNKFAQHEDVSTEEFYCQDDPDPTIFRFNISFGKTEEDFLHVKIQPVSRDATVILVRIELFDDRCSLLKSVVRSSFEPRVYWKLTGRGVDKFFKFDTTSDSESSWRLLIDLVYIALPAKSAVITADLPKLRLQDEFSQLLDSGEDSDFTFVVQGERIKAHKVFLKARCKHFESMFSPRWAETFSEEIPVNDIHPKAFKEFLRFLYTNVAPKYAEDSTMELLAVADRYCVDDLKLICEREINCNLNGDNVIDALLLAAKHHCPTLLTSAKAVFAWHAKALKSTVAWHKLLENPTIFEHLV